MTGTVCFTALLLLLIFALMFVLEKNKRDRQADRRLLEALEEAAKIPEGSVLDNMYDTCNHVIVSLDEAHPEGNLNEMLEQEVFGEEVGACVLLKDGAAWKEDEVRKVLAKSLAKFKIPAYFLVYDELPMIGTGKIDGVALRKDAIAKITAGE